MALPLLNELQERLHACAIAGLNVIGEDFRLARALEQLAQAQASSPVLARIYQTAAPLADPACADKASVLLDAITLVDAVVLTHRFRRALQRAVGALHRPDNARQRPL